MMILKTSIPGELSGSTLEYILKHQFSLTSREISRLKFQPDGFMVNGCKARTNTILQEGDVVSILLASGSNLSDIHKPTGMELNTSEIPILYEDDFFFVVDKPPGIVCHRSHGYWDSSLFDKVKWKDGALRASEARCIGRLDKDTSGIVLYAKDQITAAHLSAQRESGKLKKTYQALCEGSFDRMHSGHCICTSSEVTVPDSGEGIVDLPIGKDPEDRRKWKVNGEEARHAVTHYQILQENPGRNISLVQCTLETGRTHQIRIHMASLGHPLVGDPLYGHGKEGESRALLHCCSLDLVHPYTGRKIHLESKPKFN